MTAVATPTAQSSAHATFLVELEEFSGPLDLLLTLIRDEQVDITDIPIARVAEQFLQRIHSLGLPAAAEYLDMAARLLRIKAQLLVPRATTDDEWDDPRAELVRRLLEYEQIREIVDVLEHLAEGRRNRFARGLGPPPDALPGPAAQPLSAPPALPALMSAVDRLLRLLRDPHVHDVVPRALDVDGAMAAVRAVLSGRASARLMDVLPPDAEPWQLLSVLLALLELARRGELRLAQASPFDSVDILREVAGEAA
jgi:segregation and condensation protein A